MTRNHGNAEADLADESVTHREEQHPGELTPAHAEGSIVSPPPDVHRGFVLGHLCLAGLGGAALTFLLMLLRRARRA